MKTTTSTTRRLEAWRAVALQLAAVLCAVFAASAAYPAQDSYLVDHSGLKPPTNEANIAKNSNHALHFAYLGQMEPVAASAHLMIEHALLSPFTEAHLAVMLIKRQRALTHSLAGTLEDAERSLRHIEAAASTIGAAGTFEIAQSAALTAYPQLIDVARSKNGVPAAPIEVSYHSRDKRFLGLLVAGGLGLGGLVMGGWNSYQIANLQGRLNDVEQKQTLLAEGISAVSSQTAKLARALEQETRYFHMQLATQRRTDHAHQLKAKVAELAHHFIVLADATRDKLLPADAVTSHEARRAIHQLERKAREQEYRMITNSPTELVSLPASYAVHNNTLISILDIPLAHTGKPLALWQFTQLPFHSINGWQRVKSPHSILAEEKDPNGIFYTFSPDQFSNCRTLSNKWVCHHNPTATYKRQQPDGPDPALCLFALFDNRTSLIGETCQLEQVLERHSVTPLGPSTYAFFSQAPEKVTTSCPDATRNSITTFTGIHKVHLRPGCTATTRSRRVRPKGTDIQATLPTHTISMHLPRMLQDLANSTAIAKAVFTDQLTTINQIKAASDLLATHFDPSNPDSPFFSSGLGTVATVGSLLTFLIPSFAIYTLILLACCYRQRKVNKKRKGENERLLREAMGSQRPVAVAVHNHHTRSPTAAAEETRPKERIVRSPTDTLPTPPTPTANEFTRGLPPYPPPRQQHPSTLHRLFVAITRPAPSAPPKDGAIQMHALPASSAGSAGATNRTSITTNTNTSVPTATPVPYPDLPSRPCSPDNLDALTYRNVLPSSTSTSTSTSNPTPRPRSHQSQ